MQEERTDLKKVPDEKGKELEAEMSFFDHLDVLRGHLIRASIAIVVFAVAAFSYYSFIFDEIIMGPGRVDFWTYYGKCLLLPRKAATSAEFVHTEDVCLPSKCKGMGNAYNPIAI